MSGLNANSTYLQQQRVVLLLEYFGPAFSGSQIQDNAYTVQEAVGQALDKLNVPHGPVVFAGRTDAGVSAKGQVAHFDTPLGALEQIPDVIAGLNAVLSKDISIKDYALIPQLQEFDFHSTASAQWRWYQYRIYNHPYRSVWMRPDATWIKPALNVEAMQRGATFLLGEHDFSSFKCPRTATPNDICHVIHSRVSHNGDDVVFDIVANRFLYKMVRNIMGVLIEIGSEAGFVSEDIPLILSRQDRQSAGSTAKPQGLSLMAVRYPKPWDFFQNDIYVKRLNQVIQESSPHEKNILRKAS